MPPGYFNGSRDTVKNQKLGYCQYAAFAPVEWFENIAKPYGDPIIIDGQHEFLPGLEFIRCYATRESIASEANSTGEPGSLHKNWFVRLFIPGDSPELQVMLEQLKDDNLIFLVQELQCHDSYRLQFGSKCVPAKISKMSFTSGNRMDGRKGWEIELWSTNRFIYIDSTHLLYVEEPYWDPIYVD